MESLRLDKTCSEPHGWKMGTRGKCERVKRDEPQKPKSSVSLSMPEDSGLTLKEHQLRIAEKLKDQKGIVVFHGTGSGKTLSAINAAEEYGGAVVITPASLQDNFKKELQTYGAKGKYDIYSYEKFLTEKPDVTGRLLIADEAHRLRNAQTLTAKAVAEKAKEANKVMLLTATPVQNRPHEVASLINIASGQPLLPTSQAAFEKQYLDKGIPPWKRFFVTGNVHDLGKPKNLKEFNRISSQYVDHYFPEKEGYPAVVENTIEVPMSKSQVDTYKMFEARLDPTIRYKMKRNLPLDKQESSNLNAFINAQRQITNTERGFNVNSNERSRKTMEVVDRIQIGEGKALVYSNYLESGIKDIVGELGDRRISSRVFTGQLSRKEKDQIIRDYNADKFKVLVVSSSGGEGLDLKATRQVHILEPHWNEEKIQQVIGRAVRFKSHDTLPERDRNVEIYRYLSTFPKNVFGIQSGKVTADQYLDRLSREKRKLNDQFLNLFKQDADGIPCGKGWISPEKKCNQGILSKGKLGQQTGLLKFQADPNIKKLRNLTAEKNRIRHNRNESAVIISNKTGEVVYRGREGTPTGCNITDTSVIRGNTVLHNHPTPVAMGRSNSFSTLDIALACHHQAGEILAVNERYEYSMKPPAGGWNGAFYQQRVEPSFNKHRQDVQKKVVQRIFSREWKVDWLGRVVAPDADPYHEIWEKVAQETGMVYSKSPVIKKDQEDSRAKTPLEVEIYQLIQRVYPTRIINLKAIAESPSKITGGFVGADRKVYLFDLDLAKKQLEYGLNQYKTPNAAFRSDAKRKDPTCKESIPCQGVKGVGCVSRRKKCRQRLTRISSASQRAKIEKLAQEEFDVKDQIAFKKELSGQGIRELRILAKNAGVGNYGNQPKEVLVNTLTKLKELESTAIQTKGRDGSVVVTSEEDQMRRILSRREEQRAKGGYVSPIDPYKVALTKEQIAAKRAEDDKKKRRIQASKRALSALFPGASKVVEEFAKASSIDDKVIAGLVAGVFALRMYGSSKSEFQNNYRKGIEDQADMLYLNTDYIGEKDKPGQDIKNLKNYYEGEGLNDEEASEFVSTFKDSKGNPLSLKQDPADRDNAIKSIETGGNKEDDLQWQTDFQKSKIQGEARSSIAKAEKALDKKRRKASKQEELFKQADAIAKTVQNRVTELNGMIANAKEGDTFTIPAGLVTQELSGYVDGTLKGPFADRKKLYIESNLREFEDLSESEQKRLSDTFGKQFDLVEGIESLKTTRNVNLEQLVDARDYLRRQDESNFSRHRDSLATKVAAAKIDLEDSQSELADLKKEWSYALSSAPTKVNKLNQKAQEAAEAEIKRRKENPNISRLQKPLFPDFGEVKEGKLNRYQAWVMAKYVNQREKAGDVLAANNAIRENPSAYSLEQFKKELSTGIVVGSETAKAEEVAKQLAQDPNLKNVRFIPVENQYSRNSSIETSEPSGLPYLGRIGKYISKAIPANNKVPGLDPTKADNPDAVILASKIIAMQRYGLEPKIIAHGVGGSILQEALDIIAASKDGKTLESTRVVNFGTPKISTPSRKRVEALMGSSFYGMKDFLAANFGGRQKQMISGVDGAKYKDYLSSQAAMAKVKQMFTKI